MTHRSTPTILIVDDDVDICRNLSDILDDLGYHVDYAHDGRAGLELAIGREYDLAIVDLRMPVMDGLELAREIRRTSAATVSLLVTAWAAPETRDRALAAGAWTILEKPIDFPVLLGLLEEALDQPLVLIVDDDRDLCDSLWDLLRARGFRVSLAHEVRAALSMLERPVHEVVIIDLKLPDGDGYSVLQQVKRVNPGAGTIMITGRPNEDDRVASRARAEGAKAVCWKPFDVPELLATLDGLIERRAVREEVRP